MGKRPTVSIYDTTLRDGNQAVGISLSVQDKIDISYRLSDLGISYIEGGWPNETNLIDTEYFQKASKLNLTLTDLRCLTNNNTKTHFVRYRISVYFELTH